MKQEPFFKYLAAALIAGVILAFAIPATPVVPPDQDPAVTAGTAHPVPAGG